MVARATAAQVDDVLYQLTELNEKIEPLLDESSDLRKRLDAGKTLDQLREEVAQLKIEQSVITEAHEREKRDIEHKVGLQKTRQETELELGKREATVKVQEENLAAQQSRFDEHVKFIDGRFTEEIEYMRKLMTEVLTRLPNVETVVKLGSAQQALPAGE